MSTTKLKVVGKPTPKLDAGVRVSGKAVYGCDVNLPGMLFGAVLRAKFPCADIVAVDVSKAASLPGVACVITADSVDTNNISHKRDHPILKKGEVSCLRDEIAAVAATSREIAQKALSLIKVKYRVKEGIFDPFRALEPSAPQINRYGRNSFSNKNIAEEFHYEHGDLEGEKNRSACRIKRRYFLPRVTHCCLATSNITADYSPTERRLTLYSSTQVPFLYQRDMAHALKLEPSNIRVIQVTIGGGFGSKLDMYPFEPIAAILSMKTGRPVQIVYDRREEFLASPTRQMMVIDLMTGADTEGRFTFREVDIILDNGAYTSWGATTPFVMMQTFSSLYRVPACKFAARAVYTNNPYAGSMRGYGNPQATFALERNIDVMAREIGIDRAEIRLINANFPGEVTGQGLTYRTCGHRQALQTVIEKSGYGKTRDRQSGARRYKRGMGFASMLHVAGGAKIYRSDGCGTTVKLDAFGYLTVITGSNEIGQGSETVLAMIASEELGIGLDKIRVINSDTDIKPWDVGVHASRTSFVAGNSLLGAVGKLKEILSPKAAALLKTGVSDLVYEDEYIRSMTTGERIKLDKVVREIHFQKPNELCIANHFYEPNSELQDKEYRGNVSSAFAFGSQAVEVEVDTCTGNVRVLDVYVAQDVGRVLNPLGLQGQIEGGVVMGLGHALMEELIVENGRVLNPDFHNYKLPTASDVPNIRFYPVETLDQEGPYGAKGVGEAPLVPTPAAIANAVSDALGVEISSLPLTPENILKAIVEKHGI
ncbi:MAG: xanthine dehydrogenase family protein [Armatimonadetes bacterium]|nr:xanthine dehydrogenase family protein [Armatimonadota bacterium]